MSSVMVVLLLRVGEGDIAGGGGSVRNRAASRKGNVWCFLKGIIMSKSVGLAG